MIIMEITTDELLAYGKKYMLEMMYALKNSMGYDNEEEEKGKEESNSYGPGWDFLKECDMWINETKYNRKSEEVIELYDSVSLQALDCKCLNLFIYDKIGIRINVPYCTNLGKTPPLDCRKHDGSHKS